MIQLVKDTLTRILIFCLTTFSALHLSAQLQDTIWNFEEKCVLEYSDFYYPLSPDKGRSASEKEPVKMIAFSHLAAIRKKPAAEADIAGRVPIGETVEVRRFLDIMTAVEGVEAPWCEVKYKGKKGYMWTGALTSGAIQLSDSSYVCWGLARIAGSEDDYQCTASLRRFKNGQQLQRLEVNVSTVEEGTSGQLHLWCSPALTGVQNVIELTTYGQEAETYNTYSYLTWDGKNLKYVASGYWRGDEPYSDDSRMVTFPYPAFVSMERQRQVRGYPASNQIMVRESFGAWNEDCVWDEHVELKFLAWPDLLPEGCE